MLVPPAQTPEFGESEVIVGAGPRRNRDALAGPVPGNRLAEKLPLLAIP